MTSFWEKNEELIKAEMKKTYSETVVENSVNPRNVGDIEDLDEELYMLENRIYQELKQALELQKA